MLLSVRIKEYVKERENIKVLLAKKDQSHHEVRDM